MRHFREHGFMSAAIGSAGSPARRDESTRCPSACNYLAGTANAVKAACSAGDIEARHHAHDSNDLWIVGWVEFLRLLRRARILPITYPREPMMGFAIAREERAMALPILQCLSWRL